MRKFTQRGFTTVEMLLVVGIMVIITAVTTPIYASLNNNNQLDSAANILVQDLYQAQTYSRNHAQDSSWGVAVNGQTITLFSGSSYATRNTGSDVVYTVPSSIQLTGSTQIVYSKLYGLPTSTASFGLTAKGKAMTVTVNSKGMVEY